MDKFAPLFKNPYSKVICKKKELDDFLNINIMNGEFKLFSCGELYYIMFQGKKLGYYLVYLEPVVSEEAKFQRYWADNSMTQTQADAWARELSKNPKESL
jgi:hypothetical protein